MIARRSILRAVVGFAGAGALEKAGALTPAAVENVVTQECVPCGTGRSNPMGVSSYELADMLSPWHERNVWDFAQASPAIAGKKSWSPAFKQHVAREEYLKRERVQQIVRNMDETMVGRIVRRLL